MILRPPEEDPGETPEEYGEKVAAFIDQLSSSGVIIKTKNYQRFCEFSALSFSFGDPRRFKEGFLKKRSGGRYKHETGCCARNCGFLCRSWSRRWFIVTGDFVSYMSKIDSHEIQEILLFDSTFKVSYDDKITGKENSIMITNSGRSLIVTAKDKIEQMIWVKAIDEAFKTSEWSTRAVKRFGSFAPARLNNECRSFSDAVEYLSVVHDALKEAKEVVFITDWWLSPKLYLKRPVASDPKHRNESSRLDLILKEIANRGVTVYVLMFKEITLAVPLNSQYSKKVLVDASDNIHVIRHPREVVFSTARDFINLWSHHEKMIAIDYKTVFMGGIDLCFGRMDTHEHPLVDLPNAKGEVFFPGQDYNNVRIADFIKVEDPELCLLDRDSQPRMPWHDVAVMLKGQVVKDFIIHFVQYWNHAMIDTSGTSNKGKLLYPVYNENRTLMLTSEQLKHAGGGLNSQEAEPRLEEEQKVREITKSRISIELRYCW